MASNRVLAGVPARVISIDLRDPATLLTIQLAEPPGPGEVLAPPRGDAPFARMVARSQAAALINGTFFSLEARPSLMGTLVEAGRLAHHVSWRPHGTTFGLKHGNQPVMAPASQAWWREHWLSITAGPRLLTDGEPRINAAAEGFQDPHVMGAATRSALGYDRAGARLWLVSFPTAITLERTARALRALGCWQAMNLDGGTSRALAERGRITVAPGRRLTNAIAVYDALTPAPPALTSAYAGFRKVLAKPGPFGMTDPGPFACGARRAPMRLGTGSSYGFEDWRFKRVARTPILTNADGWLEVRGGSVFGRWPTRVLPAGGFRLSFLCRPLGGGLNLTFAAEPRAGGLGGLQLAAKAGQVVLSRGGKALGQAPLGPGDAGRHLVAFEARGGRARVFWDGRLVGEAAGVKYGAGLGVGDAAVKWLLRDPLDLGGPSASR